MIDSQARKHILVVSQYFFPENFRVNDLCREWVKRGYKVTVLTGIPNYPEGKFHDGYSLWGNRHESYEGIDIIRLPIIPRGKSSIQLVLNYLSFVVSGFFWKLLTRIKTDYVFIYEVSPMSQALPGVWYARRRKIPCAIYVLDLWPENVEVVAGIKSQFVLRIIDKMVDYIYKRCDSIFVSSKSFMSNILARGVPDNKVSFWPQYAEDFYKPTNVDTNDAPEIDRNVLNFIFAGNIGYAQGLEVLPEVAGILKEKGTKIVFNLVGDGRFKEKLIQEINKLTVSEYFNFIDRKPAEEIPMYLSASDVALITLADNPVFNMTLPAKLQSYMACGTPLLIAANGEVQDLVVGARAGLAGASGDTEALYRNIMSFIEMDSEDRQIMGKNALAYSQAHFSKSKLMDEMSLYFSSAIEEDRV